MLEPEKDMDEPVKKTTKTRNAATSYCSFMQIKNFERALSICTSMKSVEIGGLNGQDEKKNGTQKYLVVIRK